MSRPLRRGSPHRLLVALALALTLTSAGCARLLVRPGGRTPLDAAAVIAAGVERERAERGLRLTLSVRATAGPLAARLTSPAYLAIEDPEHLRLQVLSPFGVTVLDLTTAGDRFTLTLPLANERREGRIDLEALTSGSVAEDERMIVALAVLFRPKMSPERCRMAGPFAVRCPVADDLAATVTVDPTLRPIREEYHTQGGRTLFVAELADYPDAGRTTLPGRITISDGRDGPALVIRVIRARRAGERPETAGNAAGTTRGVGNPYFLPSPAAACALR